MENRTNITNEDKQLLLKDLCARLPYGVKYKDAHGNEQFLIVWSKGFHTALNTILYDDRPSLYLHLMSSMTEEEQKIFDGFCVIDEEAWKGNGVVGFINQSKIFEKAINFLNSQHFDYRGLIEKGLAIEAPEGMYNIKTE